MIIELIEKLAANGVLVTFLVSMVPILELRGAIPLGVSLGLSHFEALGISVLGNMLPVPFVVIFVRQIFGFMKQKIPALHGFVERMEKKAESKKEMIRKWQLFGLVMLVAIPIPGTGAWTGAVIAGLLNVKKRQAIPAICLGVVIAGILVTGITYGFTNLFI